MTQATGPILPVAITRHERRSIVIHGIVQGVGFRPFVYSLASRFQFAGLVKNQNGAVVIEVEGAQADLDAFIEHMMTSPPPLARIANLTWHRQPCRGGSGFRIENSDAATPGPVFLSPDIATCAACLAEMWNPHDRRYRYPFLNCTHCGPRLTIIQGAPYDRERTTMAAFPMCAACREEYEAPANRRFHAQPTACPQCGPRLIALDAAGKRVETAEPLARLLAALRQGQIAAMKGLGGYHLVCDASRQDTVRELRRRKHRDEKPFALMLGNVEAVQAYCKLSAAEKEMLASPARPIVLLRKKPSLQGLCEEIAPRNPFLGVMLPYTPLHHLLLDAVAGMPLVMTSGNQADEPIAYQEADAVRRLAGIADLFLTHDRPIHVRCDDSVTRIVAGIELPLRRSRGYAPQPVDLPFSCSRPILAVGGQFKGTFALGRDRHAFLSHHLGDLDHFEAYRAFERDLALYQQLFDITPEVITHDLHPDYVSTHFARQTAAENTLLVPVQHHHAHLASCMAENGLNGSVIGVIFDGTGYGHDGAIWGGEFLVGGYRHCRRLAHLRYVGLPGGSQAIREPWRMALAHLDDAGVGPSMLGSRIASAEIQVVRQLLKRRFNTPWTSSAGRLFDAVASLAGVRDRVTFEGQAAMELEWLASTAAADNVYPVDLVNLAQPEECLVVDTRPLIRAVAKDVQGGTRPATISRRFHSTLVDIIANVCANLRKAIGIERVVLSGGVFMNALLTEETTAKLQRDGFQVFRHRLVPPNDGGLSLGQLAVACGTGVE